LKNFRKYFARLMPSIFLIFPLDTLTNKGHF